MLIPNKIRLSVNVTMIEAWEANIGGGEPSGAEREGGQELK